MIYFEIVFFFCPDEGWIVRNIDKRCVYVKEEKFTNEQILPIL